MKNKLLVYIGSSTILIIAFVATSIMYKKGKNEELSFLAKENSEIFVRDYSPRYGDKDAKVFLTEFLDPECESCRSFHPQIKTILKEFEGKVQLVVKYAPFHKNSQLAITALEAVRMQGQYWSALEMLFHYQPYWGNHHNPKPELIFKYLANLKIDMNKLKEDMSDPKIKKIIEQDSLDLRKLKVRGTPAFFVNGKPLPKFGIEHLRKLIAKEISLQYE